LLGFGLRASVVTTDAIAMPLAQTSASRAQEHGCRRSRARHAPVLVENLRWTLLLHIRNDHSSMHCQTALACRLSTRSFPSRRHEEACRLQSSSDFTILTKSSQRIEENERIQKENELFQ
jgi:hypothetical protein